MSSGPDVVFLGPSLSRERAREIHPDVVILPPAAMGDVLAAVRRYRPRVIGLVDGTFLANMSVFHKELLYALDQGTWLLGSSSMGALRAAECHQYGMIGVGGIFEDLVAGAIEDDDEVALTHADAREQYRGLSDAMVTIRATIAAAVEAGVVSAETGAALVERQKARWFPERHLSESVTDAADLGCPPEQVAALRDFVRSRVVDPKARDAEELLRRMREVPDGPFPDPPQVVMSAVFRAVLARDLVVEADGAGVSYERMRHYALLNESDYPDVMRATRQRLVLAQVSAWFGGPPTESERAAGRAEICRRLGITTGHLEQRARELDVDDTELANIVTGEALMLRLENSHLGLSTHNISTQSFVHELRLRGRYEEVKQRAALQEQAARSVVATGTIPAEQLLVSHAALTGWEIPQDIQAYLDEHGFGSIHELIGSVSTSVKAHQALFGVGLVETEGAGIGLMDDGEPMMTRDQ